MNTLQQFIDNPQLLNTSLEETKNNYRFLDPGWYLYRKVLEYDIKNKFSNNFIELVYVTLSAWNMNSRQAKLQDYEIFKKSIKNSGNKNLIINLNKKNIKYITKQKTVKKLKVLFKNLDLVAKNKPKLVTTSKTLHFFLPNLISPIDRKHTLKYFYNNEYIPDSEERQFERFLAIQKEYSNLVNRCNLQEFKDNTWNHNIPKIIDNIIIGYQSLRDND